MVSRDDLIGWLGVVAVLGSFAVVRFTAIESTSILELLAVLGSVAIAFVAYRKEAYPAAAITALMSVLGLISFVGGFL